MGREHFRPSAAVEPQEERRLIAALEKIDMAAFEANRSVLARQVGRVDIQDFRRLAAMAAAARAHWVREALALGEKGLPPTEAQVRHLAQLRSAFEELSESYDATRRMVERGYLCYLDTTG